MLMEVIYLTSSEIAAWLQVLLGVLALIVAWMTLQNTNKIDNSLKAAKQRIASKNIYSNHRATMLSSLNLVRSRLRETGSVCFLDVCDINEVISRLNGLVDFWSSDEQQTITDFSKLIDSWMQSTDELNNDTQSAAKCLRYLDPLIATIEDKEYKYYDA